MNETDVPVPTPADAATPKHSASYAKAGSFPCGAPLVRWAEADAASEPATEKRPQTEFQENTHVSH